MLHGPASQWQEDSSSKYKMKLGVVMFLIYAAVYAGFVILNVFRPVLMEVPVLAGMNLAAVYGFGLIIFALVLALIYNSFCAKKEKEPPQASAGKGKGK